MQTPDTAGFDRSEAAHAWWSATLRPKNDTSAARAARARLRRASDWRDAMLEPAALGLLDALRICRDTAHASRIEAALDLARVLAHVETHDVRPLLRAVGFAKPPADLKKADERPRLALTRFNRLMRAAPDELADMLIRLVRLTGGTANVKDLTRAMLDWGTPGRGDHLRRDWAFNYYAAGGPTAADQEQTTLEGTAP